MEHADRTPALDRLANRQLGISLAAADERKPSTSLINKLERVLSRTRCVGDINLWSRRYAFGLDQDYRLSTDRIDFSLKRMGSATRPSREIVTFRLFPVLDDSQFNRADGYYVPSSGKAKVTYCGSNRVERNGRELKR